MEDSVNQQDGVRQFSPTSRKNETESQRMRREYLSGMQESSTRTGSNHIKDRQEDSSRNEISWGSCTGIEDGTRQRSYSDPLSKRGSSSQMRAIHPIAAGALYSIPALRVEARVATPISPTGSANGNSLKPQATGSTTTMSPTEVQQQGMIHKMSLQIKQLQERLEDEQRQRARLESKLANKARELSQRTAELQQCKAKLEASTHEAEKIELRRQNKDLVERNQSLEREISELKGEIHELTKHVKHLEAKLESQNQKILDQLCHMQQDFTQLKMEVDKKQDKPEISQDDSQVPSVHPVQASDRMDSETVKTFAFGKNDTISVCRESSVRTGTSSSLSSDSKQNQ